MYYTVSRQISMDTSLETLKIGLFYHIKHVAFAIAIGSAESA